ncbi:MAG: hypothetical protein ABFS08_05630 [Pseudomonadota bacterium]
MENSSNKKQDAFDMIANAMNDFSDEMEYFDSLGTKIAAKTRFIMRSVFAILTIGSLYMIVMIYQMANSMGVMTNHLEDMYGRFSTMSGDMREITRMVDSMGTNISGIPDIAESMTIIDSDVRAMSGSVNKMNGSVTNIDNDMIQINVNMKEMTGRLSNMSRSVNSMSYDVNEMAAPMNSGPMTGFWPR